MVERDGDDLLKFLEIQNSRLEKHGDKLWEEMKHFSWALYVLLGAPVYLKFCLCVDTRWLVLFPILAIVVALFAIFTIRKESRDFLDALGTVLNIEKRLGFHDESDEDTPKMLVSCSRKNSLYNEPKLRKEPN